MILSGKAIKRLLDQGDLVIDPRPIIKEASVKIHLSNFFGKSRGGLEQKEEYVVKPQEFVLSLSVEKIKISDSYAGLYDGYIGFSAQGVTSHLGSMLIDPGFEGRVTLEIFHASNASVTLKKGMRIG
jgi:deoxycytidine triphosphate deaminase